MLITTKELTELEKIIGHNCVAMVGLDGESGLEIRVRADHPKTDTFFNTGRCISHKEIHDNNPPKHVILLRLAAETKNYFDRMLSPE